MANPTIVKKSDQKLTVVEEIKRLFQVIYYEHNQEEKSDDEVPKIRVSAIISKMAFYYEKIRNSVDYEEEYLLRKNAIERILWRQIVIEGAIPLNKELKSGEIAKHLLTELIRAGYLPNNKIPEEKIGEVAGIVDKYLKLKDYGFGRINHGKEKNKLIRWITALAASEIEESLGRSQADLVSINYMYKILAANIKLPDNSPYGQDKEIQIYIGVYRNYLKFDYDMMSSILFRYYNPVWAKPADGDIKDIAGRIGDLQQMIDRQINHPLVGQLNRIIGRYTVFFTILNDVIAQDPPGVYDSLKRDPKSFARKIKEVCRKKYKIVRRKLWRAAVRSIIYIFITKSIFAIMLEVPATRWFGQDVNPYSLAVNISFPAILLFFIILFTRLPSRANSAKIVEGIEEVVFTEKKRQDFFQLREPVKRGKVLNSIFGLLYAVTFFLSFGFVVWALDKMQFNWISIVIFLFFLAFVSFFSIRIRKGARELIITEHKENIFNLFSDFFYVPIVAVGKWLSDKFSRINVFVFILDFIIEAPFKIFVEIAEEWTKYVRERKDEIV